VTGRDHSQARGLMAARLAALTGIDESWREAFAAVPRETFLPDAVWRKGPGGAALAVDQGSDPKTWSAMVYNERQTIVTQLDGGMTDGPGHFTSSSTMPLVMAQMLAVLPERGRVLEIGTGTGYNSALLAHRYGSQNVVTVEYDRQLADRARITLAKAGFPVSVVCDDGAAPLDMAGDFDAVIATCAFRRLPAAWIDACPSGRIIFPFATRWSDVAALVLDTQDGARASGRFYPGFVFMDTRAQEPADDPPCATEAGAARVSQLAPAEVTWQSPNAAFAIGLLVPGVDYRTYTEAGITRITVWDGHGSWAVVDQDPGPDGWAVREHGPRGLWVDVEEACRRWATWRRPSPDRFRAQASAGRMQFFLDEFDYPVAAVGLAA
jgi:protein-L-isoaspartate O-methyltransferase